jgi:phospholipase/lecithinase/hemolysin
MKSRRVHQSALLSALLLLIFVSPAPSMSAHQNLRVFFFGDSLSDSGNHFIAFREIAQRPFVPVPEAPYAIGGLHFTNGATWAEQLAVRLHSPKSGLPSLLAGGVFTNYAVGRARARPGAPDFPYFDLATQTGRFRSDFPVGAPPEATYAIWIGATDLNDALNALAVDPSGATSQAIVEAALGSVATSIQSLWLSGARTFLVLNIPNLALTPAVRAAGPAAGDAASYFTSAYNAGLSQALDGLGLLPDIRFVRLDADALLTEIVDDPAAAGFSNVEDACLTFGVVRSPFCRMPNQYLFWDGIHPTRAGHTIVADAAARALAAN